VLAPRVERALGLDEGDLAYFRGGGDDPMRAWAAWKAGVDALALAEPSRSLVIHGAKMTFSGMRRVLAALLPAVVATTCAGAAPSMVV
jgi:heme oxygenase